MRVSAPPNVEQIWAALRPRGSGRWEEPSEYAEPDGFPATTSEDIPSRLRPPTPWEAGQQTTAGINLGRSEDKIWSGSDLELYT